MKRVLVERSIVVIMFVMVLVVFSFAERDTRKLVEFYNSKSAVQTKKPVDLTISAAEPTSVKPLLPRN